MTAALILAGAVGGMIAFQVHIPMPWMLGSLAVSALAVGLFQKTALEGYKFPNPLRNCFVALIGVMIGTQVTPELFEILPRIPLILLALAVFVVAAHFGNYLIFQKVGGMDRSTAFYSGTPGGLMESILFGEQAGADIRVLTIQQFLRIILVISLVPTGISLWVGHPVGSAAGPVGDAAPALDLAHAAMIAGCGAVGLALARVVHLPASQLIGPMLLAAGLTLSGMVDLHLPFWLIASAQVVIGASLGLRFTGVTLRLLRRSVGLSLLSVGYMILLGGLLAALVQPIVDVDYLVMFISFAPGGVTEMSLVALSLAASPALVSLHHVLRILMTVMELTITSKWMGLR
ncbi:hypothetical protein PRI8871_02132 [Pseudoprimorskyibacter insulae]|uniref:Ammonia monooxygenase n=1 Tax=Pseudoprimorskyibacter insulae TaxID=1695997 RepID=A0A2R8AWF9_9RHOB|nr:hypothetical protein PRI8871_02132 [Pseudoprimorskyibacter insulae]